MKNKLDLIKEKMMNYKKQAKKYLLENMEKILFAVALVAQAMLLALLFLLRTLGVELPELAFIAISVTLIFCDILAVLILLS